jgi:diguanylate cyclase (GGDEF)-like protein/PAS domain S-box-containing protein
MRRMCRAILPQDLAGAAERTAVDVAIDAIAAERLFETAFAGAPTGMALVGLDGSWLKVNGALCRIMGFSEEQMRTRTFQQLTHPDDLDADLQHVEELLSGQSDGYSMEKRYVAANGSVVHALLSVSLVRDDHGRPLHFVSHVVDITERKLMEEHLRLLATHDALTGIWNRRRFEEELARQLARSLRHGETAVVLAIDLDAFKPINDELGHEAGDQVLRAVARVIARRLRGTDSVARLGGDEFAVLLCNTDLVHGEAVAHELAALIALTPIQAAGRHVNVRATIGAAVVDNTCTSVADIMGAADRAMYAAKPTRASSVESATLARLYSSISRR